MLVPNKKTRLCGIYKKRTHYTSGDYGWNSDIYIINGTALSTGYRPFGNLKADYEVCKQYEKFAKEILEDNKIDYNEKVQKVNSLLISFVNENINGGAENENK